MLKPAAVPIRLPIGRRTIIAGYSDSSFKGDNPITRAEFTALIVKTLGLPDEGPCSFSDVSKNVWCYNAIGVAFEYELSMERAITNSIPTLTLPVRRLCRSS